MFDDIEVVCPYCGEWTEVTVEPEAQGEMVQDCDVCCQPLALTVRRDEWGDADVKVGKAE